MMSKILQAMLIAATVLAVAAPAFADPYDHHDRGRHEGHRRGPYVVYSPGYVYAPPPVVYAPPPPPPIVAEPSINFVIPLHFR
jgi:hypothetical protein